MNDWTIAVLIAVAAAPVCWASTGAIKNTLKNRIKFVSHVDDAEAERRLWWSPLLILVSMLIGFAFGSATGAASSWDTLLGGASGTVGGALASFIVSLIKGNLAALVKRMVGGKSPPE